MLKFALTSLALISSVEGACPNSCSGHGTCGVDEVCTCYPGWGMVGKAGGDCSDRFCPYELAWADGPSEDGLTHKYAECSGKGLCDRNLGTCECFPGYEGSACQRQACPNDCSGHGTCEYMNELTYGVVYNQYFDGTTSDLASLGTGGKLFDNYSWDKDRARACVCDGGFTGIDCSTRMCAYGNDVMDVIPGYNENSGSGLPGHGNEVAQVQRITLYDGSSPKDNSNFAGQTFALRFTSKKNETFATQPIAWSTVDTTLEDSIEKALKNLPNKVIDNVEVDVDLTGTGVLIDVTFTGNFVQGDQHLLEVLTKECTIGCTPSITGLTNILTFPSVTSLSSVSVETPGSHNSYECGRRGKCNYDTGLCDCFAGFTGETCSIMTALV